MCIRNAYILKFRNDDVIHVAIVTIKYLHNIILLSGGSAAGFI